MAREILERLGFSGFLLTSSMAGPLPAPDLAEFPPLGDKDSASNPVKGVKKPSWVAMAQSGSVLTEHVLQYGSEEGKNFVEVPDGVIENMVPLWEDLIEGKFMDTAPHVAKIHAIVNKIWPLGNQSIRIEVFEVDSTTVKFRIKDANIRARTLRRGMWNIANIPMVVSKWSPEEEEEVVEITTIPMWVVLKHVPRQMFSWKGLGFIASAVGKPTRLHPDTILCKSFEEAKVFIEVDVTKELPKSHHFRSKLGVEADVTFVYHWLPPKCNICTKWGHSGKTCGSKKIRLLKKTDGAMETVGEESNQEKPITEMTEASSVLAIVPEGDEETNSVGEAILTETVATSDVEKTVEVVGEKGDGGSKQKEVGKEREEVAEAQLNKLTDTDKGNWSNVSPTKQGRSTLKATKEDSITSSPSGFAVLENEQEESGTVSHTEEDSEEGGILEDQSRGDAEKHNNIEKSKQEIGDGQNARRVSTRHLKSTTRTASEVKSQSTSNLASTAGRKRTTKNL